MTAPSQPIPPPDVREKGVRIRFVVLKLFFLVFFAAVGFRLVQIQVLESGRYRDLGRKQYEQKFTLPAVRGNIYDRNGNVLVSSAMFVSFAADPKIVDSDAGRVANAFAKVFGKPASVYRERLDAPGKRFVWLERSVRPAVAETVEKMRLPGIVMINEPKRLYHYDHLAGTLLGFTDLDARGISGIELSLDPVLRGRNGSVTLQRDGLGRTYQSIDYPRVEPVNGSDVVLTIDIALQAVVEEELRRGIDQNKADGGLAVFMHPRTGEVLALAVSPGLNPNRPAAGNGALARNRVVTDMFEPGSVFKIVTAAAAFEHGTVGAEQRFYAEKGKMKVQIGRYVRTITDTKPYDWLTFRQAIEVSSNIVMAKASDDIGEEHLYTTARAFGFGMPTGVDMVGEVRGTLKRPAFWSKTTLQTMSYGYEVAVTPMQILCAYAAIGNDGVLVTPYVTQAMVGPDAARTERDRSGPVRRVVSRATAELLSSAFEGVVERGTAKDVSIPGIRIAGKTGTARKFIDGTYAPGMYTSSFVGYFPADDPQVAGLVMMDNPRTQGYYGGITAGPVFRAIAERVVNTSSRMSRTVMTTRDPLLGRTISVPDVRMMRPEVAQAMLASYGLAVKTFGDGSLVVRQKPDPGQQAEEGDLVNLVVASSAEARDGAVPVPDVRGMTVRRAFNRLVIDDFDVVVRGSGVVRQQSPAAGTRSSAGSAVTLVCEPRSVVQTVLY